MESKSRSRSFFRVAVAAVIALLAIAMLLITLPTLGQSDDYGIESGAGVSSLDKIHGAATALATIAATPVPPTSTPVPPTATPLPPTSTPNPTATPLFGHTQVPDPTHPPLLPTESA